MSLARTSLGRAREALPRGLPYPSLSMTLAERIAENLATTEPRAVELAVRKSIGQTVNALPAGKSVKTWRDATKSVWLAGMRQAVLEAAGIVGDAVPPLKGASAEEAETRLGLSRLAVEIALCAGRIDSWPVESQEAVEATEMSNNIRTKITATLDKSAEAAMDENTKKTMLKTLETDAMDAAYRTAGSQFVKLAREPLVALLSRHLSPNDDSMRAKIAAFLETEIGGAILASMLSLGLAAMPANFGEVPEKLSRELRVRAMADVGDVVADVLMGPLRQVASVYLRGVVPEANLVPPGLPAAREPNPLTTTTEASFEPVNNTHRAS